MKTKVAIQNAINTAHSASAKNTIVETYDFIFGAWYMLHSLNNQKMIHLEDNASIDEVKKEITLENNLNFKGNG